jgi:hypothetical protein
LNRERFLLWWIFLFDDYFIVFLLHIICTFILKLESDFKRFHENSHIGTADSLFQDVGQMKPCNGTKLIEYEAVYPPVLREHGSELAIKLLNLPLDPPIPPLSVLQQCIFRLAVHLLVGIQQHLAERLNELAVVLIPQNLNNVASMRQVVWLE